MPLRRQGTPEDVLGEELKHFTNRNHELWVFRRNLDQPTGSSPPVLMLFGVGGIGKTWLLKRFRGSLGDPPAVPSARLDLDPTIGGRSFHNDSSYALAEIRRQLNVECPRFDLAYAMMRYKQGAGDEPLLKQSGAAKTAWELTIEFGQAAASGIPCGNVGVWLVNTGR